MGNKPPSDAAPDRPAPRPEEMVVHFLGTITPREDVDRLAAREKYLQTPGNELQWSFVEALRSGGARNLSLFAAPAVSEYPRFPQVLVSARTLGLSRREGIRYIPCVNVVGLKQLTQLVATIVLMARTVWSSRKSRSVILVYSLQSPFLLAAFLFRALLGTRVVLIIPDLAEYMNLRGNGRGLRAFLKSLDVRLGRWALSRLDGAVVVARAIATDRLPARTPFLVVDSIRGVAEPSPAASPTTGSPPAPLDAPPSPVRSILYSGVLWAEYGLGTLLDAFGELEGPGWELWLTGKGVLEPAIRERMAVDPRIKLFGHIPLPQLRALQAQASLLVSVKPSQAPFTRYSFPSKITEYMAAGRPVASTVCPGIDDEYFQYLHPLADDSPEAMRQSIEAIFRMPAAERQRRASAGVEFLRRTRSPQARGREILAFLGRC